MAKLLRGRKDSKNSLARTIDHAVTELATICALMDVQVRQQWLPHLFHILVKDAQLLDEAVEEIKAKGEMFKVTTPTGPQRIMKITSDSEHIGLAASEKEAGNAIMVLIRNSRGKTQILTSYKQGMDLRHLKQMVRIAEYRVQTGKLLSKEKALGEGKIPECPEWFYPNPNTLLNASFKHPNVPSSGLTLEELQEILEHAFIEPMREKWFKKHYTLGKRLETKSELAAAVSFLEELPQLGKQRSGKQRRRATA